jgi:hypothetical protein
LSITSTVLVFVIIPVAIIAVVASLTLAGSDRTRRSRRYRPGRPYEFRPIWFLSSPEQAGPASGARVLGGPAGGRAPALEAGIIEDSSGARVLPGRTGGASDRW